MKKISMDNDSFFCPLPWIHRFIQPTGVKYCCASTKELKVSVTEFNNSKHLADTKDDIRNGKVPLHCRECVGQEKQGFLTPRHSALKDWNYDVTTVPDQIEFLDLRYNNQCNFSCRTCGPQYSSLSGKEVTDNPELKKYFALNDSPNPNEDIMSSIQNFIPTVQRINFTGGEPLIIKSNFDILNQLIEQGRTDIQLLITTNASTFNTKMIDLFKKFTNVHWTISLDGVGAAAEYIRNGTKWKIVDNNVQQILQLKHSVSIGCTLSSYSVLDVQNIVSYFADLKKIYNNQPFEILFGVVQYPAHLDPCALPKNLLADAITNLTSAIHTLSDIPSNPKIHLDVLNNLKNKLLDVTIHTSTPKFIEFTNALDQVRHQNFNQTFNYTNYE